MKRNILLSVNRFQAVMGLCGISRAAQEAVNLIGVPPSTGEVESAQQLAMGAAVLGDVVNELELNQQEFPITSIYKCDVDTLRAALFNNGDSESAGEARHKAFELLERLAAEIAAQTDAEPESLPVPAG